MLKWDDSVSTDCIVDCLEHAKKITDTEPGAICYAVGHVGNGNIHYSASPPERTNIEVHQKIVESVDALIWSMDGNERPDLQRYNLESLRVVLQRHAYGLVINYAIAINE